MSQFDDHDGEGYLHWMEVEPDNETPRRGYADWLSERGRDDEAAYYMRWTVKVREAEEWLKRFCDNHDCPGYETVMKAIKTGHVDGEDRYNYFQWEGRDYLHFYGIDAHGEIPPEFWDDVQAALGQEIPDSKRSRSFSCSC